MLPFEFLEKFEARIPKEVIEKYNIQYDDPNGNDDAMLTIGKPDFVGVNIINIRDISADDHAITITANTGAYVMIWKKSFQTLTSLDE